MADRRSSSAVGGGVLLLQLPASSGSPSQPLHKRDIPTIVKGLKNHAKNATVCREYIVALHARIFEDAPRECRDAFSKFILNQTGGISTLLSTMENNSGDAVFLEVALVFLYNLMHVGGKRNLRTIAKIVKRGGGRICAVIINKSPTNLRVVQPACMVLIAIGAMDSKLPTLARLTGCMVNLLSICKQHMLQPKPALASVLCCLTSLSRGDLNLLHMHKRGAIPIVLDVCVKNMLRDGSTVLRWGCDLLCRLCHYEENAKEVLKEGGVALALSMCYEQCSAVDVQAVCIDLLRLLISLPEGMQQFQAAGGFPYLLTLITENNADKSEAEWLTLVNQLFRMYDITELPIPVDSELYWTPPDYAESEEGGGGGDGGSTAPAASSSANAACGANGDGALPENPNAGIRYELMSPELYEGDVADETSLADATAVHHVKPFTDPRPTPSSPLSIDFVPPVEELLQQSPQQRVEVIKRQLRRLSHASLLVHRVVYDDQARDTTMPTTKLGSVPTSLLAPSPPPTSVPNASGGARSVGLTTSSSIRGAASVVPSNGSAIPTLRFGSNFECGNLRRAIQVFDDEYDLILQPDINTTTYVQWFYFSVENMRPDVTYRFNILNMEKPSSTFNEGQRPLIFSEKRFAWSGFGWLRTGHDICYYRNSYKRVSLGKKRKDGGSGYYTLSFSIRFPHDEDRSYIANCYPYSYSDLIGYLRKLQERRTLDDCLMVQSLCTTQAGNATPLVTITNLKSSDGELASADEISKRGVVVISARVHPGESNASYMCKGVMDYLLDTTNEHAKYLRDRFVWKIVPMLNPDGVVNGNHRCSLSGKDLNREFINPDRLLNPTIYHLKEVVRHWKGVEGRNVMLYGDFHGHSRCRNFIIFACSSKKPTCGIIPERVFPRTLAELAPYFSYHNSTYKVQRSKRTTGRVVFYRELGIRMSFTLEGSMMGGVGCDFVPLSFGDAEEEICRKGSLLRMTTAHFNTAHYHTLGVMFVKTVLLISQGDQGLNTKVNDIISELLSEAQGERGSNGSTAEKRSNSSAPASGSSKKAPLSGSSTDGGSAAAAANSTLAAGGGLGSTDQLVSPNTAGGPTNGSFGGSYATARRQSRRKKQYAPTQIPPASPQELQEIYRVLLRGSGLNRVSLTDGEDLPEDDEDDVDEVDEDNDSDGGGGDDDEFDGDDVDDEGGGLAEGEGDLEMD